VRRSLSVPLAIAAAIACLAIGPATIAQTKLTTLRVATIPTDIGAEIYYARDLGLFQKAGFDVEITPIQSGSAITAAVVSNAVDIGYSNLVSLSVAHEKGINFTVLGLANMHAPRAVTAGILVVARSSPIRSAKDLAGKTVAVNALGSLPELGIRAWMERNGADPSQVKFVEFPFSALREAVTSGRVDAGALAAATSGGSPTSTMRSLHGSRHRPGSRPRIGSRRIRPTPRRSPRSSIKRPSGPTRTTKRRRQFSPTTSTSRPPRFRRRPVSSMRPARRPTTFNR